MFKPISQHSDFLKKKSEKTNNIISELINTKKRLYEYNIHNTIVFFGSARILSKDIALTQLETALQSKCKETITNAQNSLEISEYYELATKLSYKLALWSKNLDNPFHICTGGGGGIMEAANKGSYLADQPSIGFNIILPFEQNANIYIPKDLVFYFKYFFMRKYWFAYLAKAIVVFPGGFGTFDEIFEILTLIQTYKLTKNLPVVLLGTKFFKQALRTDIMFKYNLISKKDLNIFLITDSIDEAFDYIINNAKAYTINDKL